MLPLRNMKVIELAGLAPVPLCGMILSDYGAKVIRIDNHRMVFNDKVLNRGKKSICLNLKNATELKIFRRLLKDADVLLDPYRPGILEKLCLVPAELQKDNPKLVIARLSGYGQITSGDRPELVALKNRPGHDINYLAMSGVLSKLGTKERPLPPVNMLADFGAGAMSCVIGILFALLSRASSGHGGVVDCSMTLSTAYLCSFLWRSRDQAPFLWPRVDQRCANVLDGGAPFYRCYETSDHRFLAVGALEPRFYEALLRLLDIPELEVPQFDVSLWPAITARFSGIFASRSLQKWMEAINANDECCITPVLDLDEAARFWDGQFLEVDGRSEPSPQPRICDMAPSTERPSVGEHTEEVLRDLGCSDEEIRAVLTPLAANL